MSSRLFEGILWEISSKEQCKQLTEILVVSPLEGVPVESSCAKLLSFQCKLMQQSSRPECSLILAKLDNPFQLVHFLMNPRPKLSELYIQPFAGTFSWS